MPTTHQLQQLAERWRLRATGIEVKHKQTAPSLTKNLVDCLEWCAEELEELINGEKKKLPGTVTARTDSLSKDGLGASMESRVSEQQIRLQTHVRLRTSKKSLRFRDYTMIIKFKRLHPNAKAPTRAHDTDAGWDLFAHGQVINCQTGTWDYGTGIAVEIPPGYFGACFPRSSIRKYGLMLANSVGVIDSGFRGEIVFSFRNTDPHSNFPERRYNNGDRIGQLVILPFMTVKFEEAESLSDSERGDGGFGKSGV